MKRLPLLLLALAGAASADERVVVCYNYGCASQATVVYRESRLAQVRGLLDDATSAAHERELLAVVIGRLLGWAGEQTPISADRGGNYKDAGVNGKMDCIDHATTTTRLLRLLEKRGWLRWHRVVEPERRARLLAFFQHYSAVIEEVRKPPFAAGAVLSGGARFAMDSWFFDNGRPAAIVPLEAWRDGEGPDVDSGE